VAAIDMVANLSCPLLALFGEEDANPSPAHAARLREELDKHHKTYEYQMYADAGPAQDMWHRLLLFYEKHLKD
jgi:carboxymethylenebutenolidase